MPLEIGNQEIALNIKAPDAMTSLSNIANTAKAVQDYRFAKDTYASRVAHTNADSTTAQNQASLTTANLQPQIDQQAAITSSAQTGAQGAKFGLDKNYADTALQTATGLMQDPRITAGTASNPSQQYSDADAAKAITEAHAQMRLKGIPESQALAAVAPYMMQVHTPGAVQGMLANTVKGMTSAEAQVNQNLVPAASQQQISTDSNGNPTQVSRNQYGASTSIQGAQIQGQNRTDPNIIPAGENQDSISKLVNNRTQIQQSALKVPDQHTYNRNVIKLASQPELLNATGAGAAKLASLTGGIWNPNNDYATNTQSIAHNLAMSTQANEAAMGVKTDAGAATTALATGSIAMTPKALINAAKMNDATSSGAAAYAQGNEAAIKAAGNGNAGIVAQRQYQQQWASAYTPQVMMLHNAIQAGDKNEVAQIIKDVGGKGSPGALQLAKRAQAIQSLVNNGTLPPQGQ